MVEFKSMSFLLLFVLFIVIVACLLSSKCHSNIHCVFSLIHPYFNYEVFIFSSTHSTQLWFLMNGEMTYL